MGHRRAVLPLVGPQAVLETAAPSFLSGLWLFKNFFYKIDFINYGTYHIRPFHFLNTIPIETSTILHSKYIILKTKPNKNHLSQRCFGCQDGCPCTDQEGASENPWLALKNKTKPNLEIKQPFPKPTREVLVRATMTQEIIVTLALQTGSHFRCKTEVWAHGQATNTLQYH